MTWSWTVFFDVIPLIFKGMWITLGLTIACYLFAVVFGFFWTFMDRVPSKIVRWIVRWVAEFIRSTPPLVQLFFIYFAWPVVPVVGVTLDPFTATILVLVFTLVFISLKYIAPVSNRWMKGNGKLQPH